MKPLPPLQQTIFDEMTVRSFIQQHRIHPSPAGKTETLGAEGIPFSASASRIVDPDTVSEAIQRPYDNASDEWKDKATQIIYRLCQKQAEFDLDTVAEKLKPIDHLPHESRAVGQLMVKARKDGWCRIIRYEKSKRKSRHYGIISVDESLVYSPQA